MPTAGYILIGVFGLLLAVMAAVQFARCHKWIQLAIVLLCIGSYFAVVVYYLGLPTRTWIGKGPEDNTRFWAAVAILMICILVGMMAEAAYAWLDYTPEKRRRAFDWPGMIKPIFVSPLILIPTVAAFQNAQIDLTSLGFPWLMIMLTAFEKGFLWRHYLKKRVN
jgi:hypothetical protein